MIKSLSSSTLVCHVGKLSKHEIKLSTKPWITKEILAKMQYRDKVYLQVLKCNQSDPKLNFLYKKLRIVLSVVKDIKVCKSHYLKNCFLCNKNDIRKPGQELDQS